MPELRPVYRGPLYEACPLEKALPFGSKQALFWAGGGPRMSLALMESVMLGTVDPNEVIIPSESERPYPTVLKVYYPFGNINKLGLQTSCPQVVRQMIEAEGRNIRALSQTSVDIFVTKVGIPFSKKDGTLDIKRAFGLEIPLMNPGDFLEARIILKKENVDKPVMEFADILANYVVNSADPIVRSPYLYLHDAVNENHQHLATLFSKTRATGVDKDNLKRMFRKAGQYITLNREAFEALALTEELIDGHGDIRLANVALNELLGVMAFDCAPLPKWRKTLRYDHMASLYLDLLYRKQEITAYKFGEQFRTSYTNLLRDKYGEEKAGVTISNIDKLLPILLFRRSAIMAIVGFSQDHKQLAEWATRSMYEQSNIMSKAVKMSNTH